MLIKIAKLGLIAFLFGLAIWLFFWPLVECYYALSLSPLLEASMQKIMGFFIGLIAFIVAVITGHQFIS